MGKVVLCWTWSAHVNAAQVNKFCEELKLFYNLFHAELFEKKYLPLLYCFGILKSRSRHFELSKKKEAP
jgi:hypothetical protein